MPWASLSYEYDAANRLISVNGQAYTWDNNGNPSTLLRTGLLSDGLRTYTYDHADRLTQVVSDTLTTGFTYNGAGDRVAKTVDGLTVDYVLDPAAGLTQVLQETTSGQATSYLYGHDLLAQYDSGTWAYHLNDGLGSVRQLADPTGQVAASSSFSPFGVPLGESGGEPYGYTGEQWDASAGLVFLRARYYAPGVGRFVSKDPFPATFANPQSLNRWTYVKNNPINRVDRLGLFDEKLLEAQFGLAWISKWKEDQVWWRNLETAKHGDVIATEGRARIAQFVTDPSFSVKPPENPCGTLPLPYVTLEEFEANGRFLSRSDAQAFEEWRNQWRYWWDMGLHRFDPTWAQFVYEQGYWGSLMMADQAAVFDEYSLRINWSFNAMRTNTALVLDTVVLGLDTVACVESAAEALAADLLMAFGTAVGGGQGLAVGFSLDVAIAGGNPLAVSENLLGIGSWLGTMTSDVLRGDLLGEATKTSSVTMLVGFIPEANVDLAASGYQLWYDIEHYEPGQYAWLWIRSWLSPD